MHKGGLAVEEVEEAGHSRRHDKLHLLVLPPLLDGTLAQNWVACDRSRDQFSVRKRSTETYSGGQKVAEGRLVSGEHHMKRPEFIPC